MERPAICASANLTASLSYALPGLARAWGVK